MSANSEIESQVVRLVMDSFPSGLEIGAGAAGVRILVLDGDGIPVQLNEEGVKSSANRCLSGSVCEIR
jgi:hypothetical protein